VTTVAKQTTNSHKHGSQAEQGLIDLLNSFHPSMGQWVKQGLLVLIALLALLLVLRQVHASREANAAQAYAELAEAVTYEDFDRVAAAYPGTNVAQQARLAAAEKLFAEGNHKLALERFTAISSDDEVIALRAKLGEAQTREALGQSEALQLFASVGGQAATIGLLPEQVDALLGQARCQRQAGDLAKARELVDSAKKLAAADPALTQLVKTAADSLGTRQFAAAAPVATEQAAE
jgi:hypothetical protein